MNMPHDPLFTVASIIFGLIIGSFLTVCIYRVPYGRPKGPGELDPENDTDSTAQPEETEGPHLTISSPRRSLCPACSQQLRWYHNIPLFSWIALRGKCAYCKAKIPITYPLVELLTAATSYLAFHSFDLQTAALIFIFCCSLIVISFIDIDYYIIPDVISIPGMVVGGIIAVSNQFMHLFSSPPIVEGIMGAFWGFMCGGGFLFIVSWTYFKIRKRIGLGFGDVKLLGMTGILLGPEAAIYTIFVGSLVGSIIGGAMLLFMRRTIQKPLPFGPYLAIGTFLFIFVGNELPRLIAEAVHFVTG